MKKTAIVFALLSSLIISEAASAGSPPPKVYTPVSREHSDKEVLIDMSIMYVVLWAGYAASQPDIVAEIQNRDFVENVFEKGGVFWDGDEWYWNFVGHPYVGSEYYLYFRSRGYSPKMSFVGSFATSTLFEIAVETFSEPFSFNDFIITPCVGSLLGYGREKAAMRLLRTDSKAKRFLGHVLWLETNFKFFEDVQIVPAASLDGQVYGMSFVGVF